MLALNDWSADELALMAELDALADQLRQPDGLLTPGLPLHVLKDPYAGSTRQIGDHLPHGWDNRS